MTTATREQDLRFMRLALSLAQRARGCTAPNPMVGAVVARGTQILGRGYHHKAGMPHAEIEALQDARRRHHRTSGATLYVTLEPCSTHGRTPPCTEALVKAGIRRVVAATPDPNPRHAGRGLQWLRHHGIHVDTGLLEPEARRLNEAFNHWIVHHTPFVTIKAAMTLDGKIATASGDSKWITGPTARAHGMFLRQGADAILVGSNTLLADNPSLTLRLRPHPTPGSPGRPWKRIILDTHARTPTHSRVASDETARTSTIVVVGRNAPRSRVAALEQHVTVWRSPGVTRIPIPWLLHRLGRANVTHLLVEGGGEVNAAFLLGGFAHRVAFFYAPRILGGAKARHGVAGIGAPSLAKALRLQGIEWSRLGADLFLTGRVGRRKSDSN
jgi:diaminohydroxyphosphoribosylaminopyrimidine deaminase/5-amino-6-(5-phosphoribosylamino)uracil reductase